MKIKAKKSNPEGMVRLESGGEVKEILINEDFLHPKNESIAVCYKGKHSSGIVEFTPSEMEKIILAVRKKMHLIKGLKVIRP
ncbi:hypothetical protein COY95_02540 [Candidatus Woesearchaeota archaeon CG_4_10_14_0_8_um_filter_47_5]|nr:MAG: hypothetical protein COY95_02540 [Candidatus Woesearchaeota archaeon CG_4_10_14_0_8_um_filter_47_5]